MLTLYSYPSLFGVADNNGYGLKVFAFLRLAGVAFQHEHIFDAQRHTDHLVTRLLDHLYWVMSYSRWKDERYWPAFRDALLREHPQLNEEGLLKVKEHNALRYHYQGIGRYEPDAAMARGVADLQAIASLVPESGYVHGDRPGSIDAGIYGFIANIYFYDSDTPLKQCVAAHASLVRHCHALHAAVSVAVSPEA
ncbi:MAG: glutathione S-transferase C-terminal domain-containing protein [Burkholderiaceae bacterium]